MTQFPYIMISHPVTYELRSSRVPAVTKELLSHPCPITPLCAHPTPSRLGAFGYSKGNIDLFYDLVSY